MEENNLSLAEISPKEAELRQLAADYGSLAINGIDDKEGRDRVHEARMVLRAKRVEVEKKARLFREDAIQRQKAIIALEKSLVSIIEPIEDRLHAMEKEIDEQIEKEKLRALLPSRLERLEKAGLNIVGGVGFNVEHLTTMTPEEFNVYFNDRMAKKNELDAAALAAEREKIEAAKRAEQDAKDAAAREAQRKADEEARIEAAKKETEERVRREAKEAEEKAAREKKEADELAAKEQAELEGKKKFKTFLTKHGVTEAFPTYVNTDAKNPPENIIAKNGNVYSVYKLVETITL